MTNFPQIKAELDLSEAERELLEQAHTGSTGVINESRVLSDIYLAHHLRSATGSLVGATDGLQVAIKKSTKKIIESNENLAESNRRYALGLNILTGALVLVTFAQLIF